MLLWLAGYLTAIRGPKETPENNWFHSMLFCRASNRLALVAT